MASPRQPCNQPFYAFYQVPVEHFALWPPGPFTSGCSPYSLFLHYSSLHFSHVVGIHWLLTFPPIFTSSTWSLLQMPSCSGDYQNQVLWNQPSAPPGSPTYIQPLRLPPSQFRLLSLCSMTTSPPFYLSGRSEMELLVTKETTWTGQRRQDGSNSHWMQFTGQVAIKCDVYISADSAGTTAAREAG